MKISDLAAPSVTAWIVALATVGAIALVPSRPATDETRVARPPIADVRVAVPGLRGDPTEGVDDLLFVDVGDGREDENRYGYTYRTGVEPQS